MEKLISIMSVLALTACASTPDTSTKSSISETQKFSEATPDCQNLYVSYEATMAQFKPKKKTMFDKALSVASVGTNVFAGKLIGSGVNPDDLSTTMKGIDAAQTARGGNNISTLLNAGSAISASKEAYTYARENDCDAEVLSNIADNNT